MITISHLDVQYISTTTCGNSSCQPLQAYLGQVSAKFIIHQGVQNEPDQPLDCQLNYQKSALTVILWPCLVGSDRTGWDQVIHSSYSL